MEARMKNPAMILNVNPSIQTMMAAVYQSGISLEVLEYVGLRVGQMNNCELCIGESIIRSKDNPSTRDRIEFVSTWKNSGKFNDAEEVALELTEAVTRLNNRYQSVSDELWYKVEQFFEEKQRAALVLFISVMNMFTRVNVATGQLTSDWASTEN